MSHAPPLPMPTAAYLRNSQWIIDHYSELLRNLGVCWVAVHDGKVLSSGPALGPVTDVAERVAPAADIAFQFIDDATLIY
ncbi:MAG: hypothetical protein HZA51_09725 [Planctomycetes bacterium]|nr:hypothetical protein [Planctomycetota bacterium]